MGNLWLVYLLFMYIGISFNLAGVISMEIANTFRVDTAIIGYTFSLFSIGYSLAILGNGCLLDRVKLKSLMCVSLVITMFGIITAAYSINIQMFTIAIFTAGVGMGVLCSSGNYYMVCSFDDKERTSKLSILNFFYSFGAIVAPLAAGYLLEAGVSWSKVYLVSMICLVPVVLLTVTSSFRLAGAEQKNPANTRVSTDEQWGIAIYLIGAALFCYVISEMILTYWLVAYLIERYTLAVNEAGIGLSLFWFFMAGGRLLSGYAAGKISVVRFIMICAGLGFLTFGCMLTVSEPYLAMVLVSVLGLSYAGLYPSILSYGTQQTAGASSKLMTFFITVGSAGGILSFVISSFLKQNSGITAALLLSVAAIGLVCVFAGVAQLYVYSRKNNEY